MIITSDMERLCRRMVRHANSDLYHGGEMEMMLPYFQDSRRFHKPSGTSLMFMRDSGYHSSGWWKNPDYERCYHLSLSFWFSEDGKLKRRPFDHRAAEAWVRLFYPTYVNAVWEEPPTGKVEIELYHYRVFCDPAWQPIIPRKEVYTRDFTPAGWKSWSDRLGE